jgi:hypothetical protein
VSDARQGIEQVKASHAIFFEKGYPVDVEQQWQNKAMRPHRLHDRVLAIAGRKLIAVNIGTQFHQKLRVRGHLPTDGIMWCDHGR